MTTKNHQHKSGQFVVSSLDRWLLLIGFFACVLNLGRNIYIRGFGGSDPFPFSYHNLILLRTALVIVSTKFGISIFSLLSKAFSQRRYFLVVLCLFFLSSVFWFFLYAYRLGWLFQYARLAYLLSFYIYNISFVLICVYVYFSASRKSKYGKEPSTTSARFFPYVNFTYCAVPILLIALGSFLIKQHLNISQAQAITSSPKKQWEFIIKPWREMPFFTCQAGKRYTFTTNAREIRVLHYGNSWIKRYPLGNTFALEFQRNTKVKLEVEHIGEFWKRSTVTVREGASSAPLWRLDYLSAKKFSPYTIKVKRGQRLDISSKKEIYYVVYFQNNKEVRRKLIKNNGHDRYFWFWEPYDLKIMPAEVGFTFIDVLTPYYESLRINGKYHSHALFLESGDIYETPFYVDNYDDIYLKSRGERLSNEEFNLVIGGKEHENNENPFKRSGMLKIKALQPLILTEIKVDHDTQWTMDLEPNKEDTLTVFKGDVIQSKSGSRYYVDGVIVPANQRNTHYIKEDRNLVFKGSVIQKDITVTAVKRRGW